MDVVRFAKQSKFVGPLTAGFLWIFSACSFWSGTWSSPTAGSPKWKRMVQMMFLFISRFHASSWGGVIWSTSPFCRPKVFKVMYQPRNPSGLQFPWIWAVWNSHVSLHLKLPRRFKRWQNTQIIGRDTCNCSLGKARVTYKQQVENFQGVKMHWKKHITWKPGTRVFSTNKRFWQVFPSSLRPGKKCFGHVKAQELGWPFGTAFSLMLWFQLVPMPFCWRSTASLLFFCVGAVVW